MSRRNRAGQIDQALIDLEKRYWLDSLCAELSGLHREAGHPEQPPVGFGRSPGQMPFLKPSKLEGLGPYEGMAMDAYNDGVKAAYRCIGWEHVGLFMAVANTAKGTPEWKAYYTSALEAIERHFRSSETWADFDAYFIEPAQAYLKD